MTENLLPCPFCGEAAYFERHGTPRQSCIVACQSCGCSIETGETGHDCGGMWNSRATQPAASAEPALTGFVPVAASVLRTLAEPGLVKRTLGKFSPALAKKMGFTPEEGKAIEAIYLAFGESFDYPCAAPVAAQPGPAMAGDDWLSALDHYVRVLIVSVRADTIAHNGNEPDMQARLDKVESNLQQILAHARKRVQPASKGMVAMVDAAMVEMQNMHPPMRRSDCERLIWAALGVQPASGDDAKRIAWLSENDCLIERLVSTKGTKYRLSWIGEWQVDWYDTPGQAIDAAMQQENQP